MPSSESFQNEAAAPAAGSSFHFRLPDPKEMGYRDIFLTDSCKQKKDQKKRRKTHTVYLMSAKFEKGLTHVMRHDCCLLVSSFRSWSQACAEKERHRGPQKQRPRSLPPPFDMAMHICFLLRPTTHCWHSVLYPDNSEVDPSLAFLRMSHGLKNVGNIWKVSQPLIFYGGFASTK